MERFGPDRQGRVYLTAFNDSAELQRGMLRVDNGALGLPPTSHARELLSNQALVRSGGDWPVRLNSQQAAVIRLGP